MTRAIKDRYLQQDVRGYSFSHALPKPRAGVILIRREARYRIMFFHRFRSAVPARVVTEPSPSPAAFVLCPVMGLPAYSPAHGQWQQGLYEYALAQAQAVVRPSLLERDLLAVWN